MKFKSDKKMASKNEVTSTEVRSITHDRFAKFKHVIKI